MTALNKAEIAVILGERVFVRISASEDALFVSDAPRRMTPNALETVSVALNGLGYSVWVLQNNMMAIDWDETRWVRWAESIAGESVDTFPTEPSLWPVYRLYRLLDAHPAPFAKQPRAPMRELLKRDDRPQEWAMRTHNIRRACAAMLRKHQPLPVAAKGLLAEWLSRAKGE